MKKRISIAAVTVSALATLVLSALIVDAGIEFASGNGAHAEDVSTAKETESIEIQDEPEATLQVQTPSIHPAGHGFITWYYSVEGEPMDHEEMKTSTFELSPDGDVEFVQDPPTDASVHNRLVGAIQRKHKQNARAIHFMEGYMNDDLTEGTMQYASSQQIRGEIRFTVDEDGKIIANPSDWDALPETDKRTVDDFKKTAESMLVNWGREYSRD